MGGQRATVHDVARLAGLSTASVSRALSGARPVSADVAERVQRAADQLGYRPDAVGRSLRMQVTRTVGLVVADVTNPFFPMLIKAVEHECRTAELSLLLMDADNDIDVERESVALLLDKRVDALLVSPMHRHLSQAMITSASKVIPVVQLDRVADESGTYVRVDQAAAVQRIVGHFVEHGRSRLGFIGSDPSVSTSWERQVAFTEEVGRLEPSTPARVLVGDFSVEWGREAARQMKMMWPEVDAIVCANDLIALGAYQALITDSREEPGSIAISGFDDTILASTSGLTSVRQPLAELAARAVAISQAGGDEVARQVTLDPELIVRASSGV